MVLNLDIAPTILAAAGLTTPDSMQGRSFLELAQGQETDWREDFLYEYFWERNYPQTPTLHAIRTDRFKYIHYHGVWDTDELYDLREDPQEMTNLIAHPEYLTQVNQMNARLFNLLEETGGMFIPLYRDRGRPQVLRHADGTEPGRFPEWMIVNPELQTNQADRP